MTPLEILDVEDSWSRISDAHFAADRLNNCFDAFASYAAEWFDESGCAPLGVSIAYQKNTDHFVASHAGSEIRFSFSQKYGAETLGLVVAHKQPRHQDFEKPLYLGEFAFDLQTKTSVLTNGKYISLNRTVMPALVMHFCIKAGEVGFVPK
jgi:hypothetical protein